MHTTFEEELQDCVLGQEAKRFPGSSKIIIMIYNAVFFFSELKFAHEQESVNTSGVTKVAYTHNTIMMM